MQEILAKYKTVTTDNIKTWFHAGETSNFQEESGSCIKYGTKQIAVFNFENKTKWYASQNLCPHKLEMVLSRGMTGTAGEIPKIACPLHKKTFSLIDGSSISGDDLQIAIYPVKIENNQVYIGFSD